MERSLISKESIRRTALLLSSIVIAGSCTMATAQIKLNPQTMTKITDVDQRYVSYNIEAVEVTGGRFWKPFKAKPGTEPKDAGANHNEPVGTLSSLYQFRSPIDLSNNRLRTLAKALSPAYVRVSGTWRNSTYFQDNDEAVLASPPEGFRGVMSRKQWKSVVDFAHAVNADIVTSVATSDGTRDGKGVWRPEQALRLFDYTKSIGGKIAAIEFMNEPTFASVGGAPLHYNGTDFGRDAKLFGEFLRKESPDTIYLGPGSIGEAVPMIPGLSNMPRPEMINSEDMLKASGPIFDAFSYHFYMSISRRCTGSLGTDIGMKPEDSLKPQWLERNTEVEQFYAALREKYLPGKTIWLTETGQAACGGDRFAAQFADSFRYAIQLGSLAQANVKTVMQNTLASSDYGLLDEDTLTPRPNYWTALLWKRTMGARVLDPGIKPVSALRVFAHCTRGQGGGVTMAIINTDLRQDGSLLLPTASERYTLSARDLTSDSIMLNGIALKVSIDGELPRLKGSPTKAGVVRFAPLTITFLVLPNARNEACQD